MLFFTLPIVLVPLILSKVKFNAFAYTADEFVTVWKTDNPGTSNSTSITIPTTGSGYNYDVDWTCDGTFDDIGVTGDITHDYQTAGTYNVCIRGTFPQIYFNNDGDKEKILDVKQWGTIQWRSMQRAFFGANNLDVTATDTPNLTTVTNMEAMFSGTSSLVGNASFNNWNTSNIVNFSSIFSDSPKFNQPIGNWNTSNATNMRATFLNASSFNQDISNWILRR